MTQLSKVSHMPKRIPLLPIGLLQIGLISTSLFIFQFASPDQATAQQSQTPVQTRFQLPVRSVFTMNTVVSVPDGGIMRLGGVSSSASGGTAYGIPGIGSPLGRPFRNQAFGQTAAASQANIRVRILSNREMEAEVMATANRRDYTQRLLDPNGSQAIQKRADFITRNIGRSSRR